MKHEANFQSKFNNYLKHVYKKTGAFELKQTQTDSLPFSAVEDHQVEALQNVDGGTFVFKIPDCGYQNPFDCFSFTRQSAYVVVYFARTGFFYGIGIGEFVRESSLSVRRSLTEARAKEIASFQSTI